MNEYGVVHKREREISRSLSLHFTMFLFKIDKANTRKRERENNEIKVGEGKKYLIMIPV